MLRVDLKNLSKNDPSASEKKNTHTHKLKMSVPKLKEYHNSSEVITQEVETLIKLQHN